MTSSTQEALNFLNKVVTQDNTSIENAGMAMAVHAYSHNPRDRRKAMEAADKHLGDVAKLVLNEPMFEDCREKAVVNGIKHCVQSALEALSIIGIALENDEFSEEVQEDESV
jgi:cellobiose phosphorylase